jgi:hypothetical protein
LLQYNFQTQERINSRLQNPVMGMCPSATFAAVSGDEYLWNYYEFTSPG